MRIRAKQYKFIECECKNSAGTLVKIPAGIWDVAELDLVSIYLKGTIVIDLFNPTFQLLKAEGKATLVS